MQASSLNVGLPSRTGRYLESNGHRRSACCATWVLCVPEGQLHKPSGLNLPRPTAAGPPGRSICSSLISRVFGVSPLCIPNRRPTAPCLLPNLGSFAGPGVVCTATQISNTHNPRIVPPTQPWLFLQSRDCGTLWVLYGTSLEILGLKLYEAPLPKGTCNPRIAGLQSQSQVSAIPGKGSFTLSEVCRFWAAQM